jgi:hypothetical protein
MDKEIKIYQEHMRIDYDDPNRYLIIVEIEDNTPVASYVVRIPKSAKYCDQLYPYYYYVPN